MPKYLIIFLAVCLPFEAFGASGDDIARKSQEAFFYAGGDFKARLTMRLAAKGGQTRIREIAMLRKNYGAPGGEQKYFIYFFKPPDVKDMTFMVYKRPGKDDDRWLFVPALNMVRRIAARDKHSSFVGSDFTYEDVSGRDIEDDAHEILREEKTSYVLKSAPKAADADYIYKVSWIDKKTFLPLKEEYYDGSGELFKVFTADEVTEIKGRWTVAKRTMKNIRSGHSTEVIFTDVGYDVGIEDGLFSERYLRQPPRRWIE